MLHFVFTGLTCLFVLSKLLQMLVEPTAHGFLVEMNEAVIYDSRHDKHESGCLQAMVRSSPHYLRSSLTVCCDNFIGPSHSNASGRDPTVSNGRCNTIFFFVTKYVQHMAGWSSPFTGTVCSHISHRLHRIPHGYAALELLSCSA